MRTQGLFKYTKKYFSKPYAIQNDVSDNIIKIIHFYGVMTCVDVK